ncbi:hypothetical protein [Streptomyces sp. URMC 129]|uniref:hypothetical protein n=1 Tax=Streptomyces sp. URMC 129 TaxID=3423407 RepID=UPI003F1A8CE1
MRPVVTVLAAGTLALAAVPGPAHAANGRLVINGTEHLSPSGCYTDTGSSPMRVLNDMDHPAVIHESVNCAGAVDMVIQPGEYRVTDQGKSVFVEVPEEEDPEEAEEPESGGAG